ncbi:MAG: rod shape-determining protein MreD [Terriglobales bacterium]
MAITYTSREQIEVYRFGAMASVGITLVALLAQAFLPLLMPGFTILDLPLLVTIFFAMARRSPVSGLLTGGVIGLLQDSLTHHPIGVFGMAKTVVGYGASSLGVRIDVENTMARLGVTFGFYLVHHVVFFVIARGLVGLEMEWRWGYLILAAVINAVVALPVYALLDRFKHRT